MDNSAKNLANNIKQLREERSITQQQLAKMSGIARPTCASLETGSSNPTLSVLNKLAGALQISIEELIAPPRSQVEFFKAGFGKTRKKSGGNISPLLPEVISGLDIERIELNAAGVFVGAAHTKGTREYLSCESGQIELIAAGNRWLLKAGDAIVFRGDQRHTYRNPNKQKHCVAISVVCIPS